MKRLGATLLAALVLGGSVGGCASGTTEEGVVDDAAISAGVQAALRQEPSLRTRDIRVAADKGVVQLSGYVSSAENVATASAVARTVKGVKSVRNDLRLK